MATRRDFLKSTSLLTLGALASCANGAEAGQKAQPAIGSKNCGLQLYSLGPELGKDVAGGLKRLKEFGYNNVELVGFKDDTISNMPAADFKKLCDDAGLKILSSHCNPPVREYTKDNKAEVLEYWKKTAAGHAAIGCPYLVQPGLPQTRSEEETKFVAEVFNEAGQIAKAEGVKWGYHNHEMEFAKVVPGGTESKFGRRVNEGKAIEEIFIENTDPENVLFELDVYWTVMGQHDPVEFINKYANRIQLLHIKDVMVLGESGMMNFENIFNAFYANGHKDWFVEIEGTQSGIQFDRVKASADFLYRSDFVK